MEKTFLYICLLLVGSTSCWALTFRTPPLDEWDFSLACTPAYVETVTYTTTQDIVSTWTRNTASGSITPTITEGSGVGRSASFLLSSNTPDVTLNERTGVWSTYQETNPIFFVRYGGLKKKYSFTVSDAYEEDPDHVYNSGTLGKYLTDVTDDLTDGVTASEATTLMYSAADEATGTWTWNTSCWTWPIDLTSFALWRDGGGTGTWNFTVMAITSRHVVAGHASIYNSQTYNFYTRENTLVARTIPTDVAFGDGNTYFVGLLSSPLPATITPAKLLPADFEDYAPNPSVVNVPIIQMDQDRHTHRNYWKGFGDHTWNETEFLHHLKSTYDDTDDFSAELISGDSSSPYYFEINGETVLVGSHWGGSGGTEYGLVYGLNLEAINAAIETLEGVGPGEASEYPEVVDLSGFPSY